MAYPTWEFIRDLPENWSELSSSELESLASIWKDNIEQLQKRDAVKLFTDLPPFSRTLF